MEKRIDFKTYQEEAFKKNPELKAEYERLRPEFEVLHKLIKARKKAALSQLELAERLQLQQPAIARLERGGYASTSISKISRIADALGYHVRISFIAKKTKTAPTKQATKRTVKAKKS